MWKEKNCFGEKKHQPSNIRPKQPEEFRRVRELERKFQLEDFGRLGRDGRMKLG